MAIIKRVFCLDLPTAGYVVGYLGILGGIYEVFEILSGIIYFEDYYAAAAKTYEELRSRKAAFHAILYVMLVICLFELLTSIILIRGIKKNSHKMILPWLVLKGIGLVVLIPITSLLILLGLILIFNGYGYGIFIINMVWLIIVVAIYCYFYVVIYSLYQFIRDELRKPRPSESEGLYSHFDHAAAVYYNKT